MQPTPQPESSLFDGASPAEPRPRTHGPITTAPARLRNRPTRTIEPFHVMELMRDASRHEAELLSAGGAGVVHLEVGQPSTKAPKGVIEAAHNALDAVLLGYTNALGVDELRERIARYYADRFATAVPPERIVITDGASGAFLVAFLAMFSPGDRVGLPEPGYPCYRNVLEQLGVEVVPITLTADNTERPFVLRPADLAGADVDAVVIASPSNPTGTALSPKEMDELAGYCAARGISMVVDEIYQELVYDREPSTVLTLPAATNGDLDLLVINSFSKYFSMTGWRLGWMVVGHDRLEQVERLLQNLFICAPALSQHAGIAAFDCTEELNGHIERYRQNRDVWIETLRELGLTHIAPADGAFYVWVDVSSLTNDSQTLARRLLYEANIAVTPGIDFDRHRGNRFVRLSYSGSLADAIQGAARLTRWVHDPPRDHGIDRTQP